MKAYFEMQRTMEPLLYGVPFDEKHETTAVNAFLRLVRKYELEGIYPDVAIVTVTRPGFEHKYLINRASGAHLWMGEISGLIVRAGVMEVSV